MSECRSGNQNWLSDPPGIPVVTLAFLSKNQKRRVRGTVKFDSVQAGGDVLSQKSNRGKTLSNHR